MIRIVYHKNWTKKLYKEERLDILYVQYYIDGKKDKYFIRIYNVAARIKLHVPIWYNIPLENRISKDQQIVYNLD